MNKLRSILFDNRLYLIGYLVAFLGGLGFLWHLGKAGSFLYLNPYHAKAPDWFFTWFTYLGDGVFTVLVILLFIKRKRFAPALEILTAFLLSALLAQIFKALFSMPRPREYFNKGQYTGTYNHFIEGVTGRGFSSFPSGHSTSIFALMTVLAIMEPNKRTKFLYLLLGVAVGYSRIYLGQHFLPDVLAGSMLGTFTGVLVHWMLSDRYNTWIANWKWLRRRAEKRAMANRH